MKKIIFLPLIALASQQAHAAPACTAANLNGNYALFQAAVNSNTLNHNGACNISISGGIVAGTCDFSTNTAGNPGFNGPVYSPAGTSAVMNTNCSATIPISFDPVPGVVHVDSVFEVQFTPDKQSFVGRWDNNFGLAGVTNGTRYSPLLPATPAP